MKTGGGVLLLSLALLLPFFCLPQNSQPFKGRWKLLKRSIGISAMHTALLPNDRIITFDRTDFGPSNITLPRSKCQAASPAQVLDADCYAHSVEFTPANRNVRPLTLQTNTWCSSGALSPEGVLVQTGGSNEGERRVRYLKPCPGCDWTEVQNGLLAPRWYASNQILPDGKIIVVGGRRQFSYEFIPKSSSSDKKLHRLPFLIETTDAAENNLYPFLHLSTDGNLFIFANNRAILLDYVNNRVVRNYPVMPGGVSRNFPSTGSSALLPLKLRIDQSAPEAQVLICGGSQSDALQKAKAGIFVPASKTCGRLVITAPNPKWEMEEMPMNRLLGDMILLPTGDVLIINGAAKGSAGWVLAREPVLEPVLYHVDAPRSRFEVLNPSKIQRLYHSTAHLLTDGRVLVGGSNPNPNYNFTSPYPTQLSVEAFSPPYLSPGRPRPEIKGLKPGKELGYKKRFSVVFESNEKTEPKDIYVTMVAPSFTTHSFSMNQRVLVLAVDGLRQISGGAFAVDAYAPATAVLAPPGHYLLFVVHKGVPSRANWVRVM